MNNFEEILAKYWGYPSFRPLQEDIIRQVHKGIDTLALMPTGGGKSITFQVPALAKEGICIVISPLIALMKDQVENLRDRNIKAQAIYTGMSKKEIDIALDNCLYGGFKFLYISPERIGTDIFKARAKEMDINLIAVDEAHCISQWGYDFRPSYLQITELRDIVPKAPLLALTATATPQVTDDIQEKLRFPKKNVLQKSFERKNLAYIVKKTDDKLRYLFRIANKTKGCGVVYVRNRKKTQEIALALQQNKISADFYHAGLPPEVRSKKQDSWKKNETRLMVCTNAFGMGIDKPDVRFVAHMDIPDSTEAYFQEAGRAGRDENKSWAILLYSNNDLKKSENRIEKSFPERQTIRDIYQKLGSYLQVPIGEGKHRSFDFNIGAFAKKYSIDILTTYNSIKILQYEGYIEYSEDLNIASKVYFAITRDELYRFQIANANFDTFIKLLLRTYTGLFNDYSSIDESLLAKKTSTSTDVVCKYLNTLKKYGIISYIPRKTTPIITFTEDRLPESSVVFSKENYDFRKQRMEKNISAILSYAENGNKCRSQQLLGHFGEKDGLPCGQCDVCLKKNELGLNQYEFDRISEKIKEKANNGKCQLNELVETINFPEEKVLLVISWLLDNNKISHTPEGNLKWEK